MKYVQVKSVLRMNRRTRRRGLTINSGSVIFILTLPSRHFRLSELRFFYRYMKILSYDIKHGKIQSELVVPV